MIKIAKYEFDSKEQAESKIKSLGTAQDENGNEYPTHKHTIVQQIGRASCRERV